MNTSATPVSAGPSLAGAAGVRTPPFASAWRRAHLTVDQRVAAIVTTGSGTSYVTVAGAGGKQTQIPVTPGISENGYVQVTPAAGHKLTAGDSVVVSG